MGSGQGHVIHFLILGPIISLKLLKLGTSKFDVQIDIDKWYGDGAVNTVEENSSVFSLIRMC